MAAAGVSQDSPVASLFEDMFRQLKENIERGETLTSVEDIDMLKNRERFTSDVLDRMKTALQQGQTVRTVTKGPGFSVSSEAKALANAVDGQVVQVKATNGQTLSGVARTGGVVEVSH